MSSEDNSISKLGSKFEITVFFFWRSEVYFALNNQHKGHLSEIS